jgi:hypothetical protein
MVRLTHATCAVRLAPRWISRTVLTTDYWRFRMASSTAPRRQTAADELWRRHTGQPVDKVRAAIKAHPTLRNVQFKDSTINDMAETIASGKRFHFRARVR